MIICSVVTCLTAFLCKSPLNGATRHLCRGVTIPSLSRAMDAMTKPPAKRLSWLTLCWEIDCWIMPKTPQNSFLPMVVLGILGNPPYTWTVNRCHTCVESNAWRWVWDRTRRRPISPHFYSAERSKLKRGSRNRQVNRKSLGQMSKLFPLNIHISQSLM